MSLEIRIDFTNNSGGSYSIPGFNRIATGDITGPNTQSLDDASGAQTSVNFARLTAPNPSSNTIGAGGTDGTGDAAWVLGTVNATAFGPLDTTWIGYQWQGLTPGKSYILEVYGIASSGSDSLLESRVNGGTSKFLDTVTNLSEVSRFEGVFADAGGTITLEFRKGGTSSTYISATRIIEIVGPELTLTGDLQPGASFTVNYANFEGVPVSPVTLTDSNSNSITVPVTISDNGDGTGTATGTMPALPASGTAQGLLFGNVTVELST